MYLFKVEQPIANVYCICIDGTRLSHSLSKNLAQRLVMPPLRAPLLNVNTGVSLDHENEFKYATPPIPLPKPSVA